MTALQPRTWTEGDRVARQLRRGEDWQFGTVTGVSARFLRVDWDSQLTATFADVDTTAFRHEDEVPVDERHSVPGTRTAAHTPAHTP